VDDIAAVLAFGHRLDDVRGEPRLEQRLDLQLQHLALQLLRALLGLAPGLVELLLHRRDGLVPLHNLELQPLLGLLARLRAGGFQALLNEPLHREVEGFRTGNPNPSSSVRLSVLGGRARKPADATRSG
jgi:hypothetical protein